METKALLKRVSELESLNDQLQAEIRYLDHLLRTVGFQEGLIDLKRAASELIDHSEEDE